MQISILSTSFPRFESDLIAHFFFETATRLAKGNIVNVVSPHEKGIKKSETFGGVKINRFKYMFEKYENLAYGDGLVINVKKNWFNKILLVPFMISFIFNSLKYAKKADVILVNFEPSALAGLFIKLIYKKPVVLTVLRLVEDKGVLGLVNKFIYKHVDDIIFISNYLQKESQRFLEFKQSKIIPLGVDVSRFDNKIRKLSKDKKINLINIGRLIEKKGQTFLIDAVRIVNERYPNKVKLIILGWGSLKGELIKKVKNYKLDIQILDNVGPLEVPKYLDKSDIFILSSIVDSKNETETLGVVLIEALATGLPVISTDVGGTSDIVSKEVGFLIEPKNSQAIADKIIEFIKKPSLVDKMSRNGIEKARKVFDWDNIIKQYIEILEKVSK